MADAVQTLKVRVIAPFRVIYKGVAYIGEQFELDEDKKLVKVREADVIDVPDDDEHQHWLKVHWVEFVNEKEK